MLLQLLSRMATQDFLKVLDTQFKPSKGRELRNCMLHGSLDFKGYFEQYNLQVSGLVPNARAKEGDETRVNHSWRFIRRCDPWQVYTDCSIQKFLIVFLFDYCI